jgi:quercetin dioxygenase-like cupin family protein
MPSKLRAPIRVLSHCVPVALALLATPPLPAQENPAAAAAGSGIDYARSTGGTRWLEAPGIAIKVLVEAASFGSSEVEVAELRLDPGSSGADHRHGSHEIIVMLEGAMDHMVNGETHRLEPGMVGIVRQGDTVAHRVVSETPVRAILVWAPGGEAERLGRLFKTRPVEERAE